MRLKKLSAVLATLTMLFTLVSPAAAQNVENFTISSFQTDYYLSRDSENRSQLKVTERIVAQFPNFDQNRGILRAIPEQYQGHPVSLEILRVTNQDGQPWNYTTDDQNNNRVLRIGDSDIFVHGQQTYSIEYQLRDVTRNFDGYDEFFWDINGTQWQQPFGSVVARIHLSDDIAQRFNGQTKCFTGVKDSKESACDVSADGSTITVQASRSFLAGENLSVVLGFQPDTFQPYQQSPWFWAALVAMGLVGLGVPGAAFTIMWRKWSAHGRDPKGRGTIVPEYAPPRDINPILADIIINERAETKAISATALSLCIKKYLKLYELKKGKLIGSKTEYELEVIRDPSDLSAEEQKVLEVLFGSSPAVGDKVNLNDQKNKLYSKVASLQKTANSAVAKHGYFTTNPSDARKKYLGWGVVLLIVGVAGTFILFPLALITIGLAVAGIIVLIFSGVMPARTQKGIETKEHLLGLKDYMTIAERDRIKVLQSPQGAEKTPVDPNDKAQLVKLYERLLPYAMLFGIEKDWAKQFAHLYEQPPDWYSGSRSFNSGAFAGAISGFNSASSSSFSAPSSSSSSGFSGGGGSGGGGGGGGGGGW